MSWLPIGILLSQLIGAVIALLAGLWRPLAAQAVAVVSMAIGLVFSVMAIVATQDGNVLVHELGGWPPPIGIEYILDGLSAFMVTVIAFIGLLIAIYPVRAGFGYSPSRLSPLYSLMLLILTGLTGVALSGDLFHLFVFLEVYAIASYALVSLGGGRSALAAFRYLIIGTLGGSLYLLGVGFWYFATGSLNMADISSLLPEITDSPAVGGGLALIVIGLGLKMAIFPLHVWLPEAHSSAPPAVAALLAAVQVKVGAYALIRVLYDVYGAEYLTGGLSVTTLLTYFSAAGIVTGSVLAIRATDIKRMLAYSTIAQVGFIGVGIGLGTPEAMVGGLFHVLNHAVMKSCLFLVAGGVLAQTKITKIARYAGLGKRMPWTMGGFAIAALSMVGIPPTGGFFSKWNLLQGSIAADAWIVVVIIAGSALLSAAYFLRLFEQIFTQNPQEAVVEQAHEPGPRVLGPVMVLAGCVLAAGFGNVYLVRNVLAPIAQGLLG